MSIFNEVTLAFKSLGGPFILLETTELTSHQRDNVGQVTKYLNHSKPACSLYQEALKQLRDLNGPAVKKIEIQIVPHEKNLAGGGGCYLTRNLIVVSVNETNICKKANLPFALADVDERADLPFGLADLPLALADVDERANLPLSLTETVLFELANLSYCNEFQAIHDRMKSRKITTREYAESIEKKESGSLSIVTKVIMESIEQASEVLADEECGFWSFMARRVSLYHCGLLTRKGETTNDLSRETRCIQHKEGERVSISDQEIANIDLEVQRSYGHTQLYEQNQRYDDVYDNQKCI